MPRSVQVVRVRAYGLTRADAKVCDGGTGSSGDGARRDSEGRERGEEGSGITLWVSTRAASGVPSEGVVD